MRAPGVRVAVVGHVEWVSFAAVERLPEPGEIVFAPDAWELAAGAAAVAAVQLARLAGEAMLFTALAGDALGERARRQLEAQGVRVHGAPRPAPQTQATAFLDSNGERTIVVLGTRLVPSGADDLPWERLEGADAVYFVSGDADAARAARRARVMVAASRSLPDVIGAGVEVDVLAGSGGDPSEHHDLTGMATPPRLAVVTRGGAGGELTTRGGQTETYPAAPLPGPAIDSYGAGDSFAAGLTFALGARQEVRAALALGARCGAACVAGRGPYEGQIGSLA